MKASFHLKLLNYEYCAQFFSGRNVHTALLRPLCGEASVYEPTIYMPLMSTTVDALPQSIFIQGRDYISCASRNLKR